MTLIYHRTVPRITPNGQPARRVERVRIDDGEVAIRVHSLPRLRIGMDWK
jgi:hypothetical protein